MFTKPLAALSGALTLAALCATPSLAQDQNIGGSGHGAASSNPVVTAPASRTTPSRANRQRNKPGKAPVVDPAVIKAEAEAALAAGNSPCSITDQRFLGNATEASKVLEVSCATGPGYIIVTSTPPQLIDCVVVAHTAATAPAPVPGAPAPTQTTPTCDLPGNQDIQGVLKAYATEAGVPCAVDEARIRGQSSAGNIIYEVGCAGADGYWIEKLATGWDKTECLQVVAQSAICQFTTPEEQAATAKSWLAGTEAAGCEAQQVRLMGANDKGRFMELTCAGADGVIIRQNAEMVVEQVYPCATAQQIGGGCKLTTTAPAATAPEA